MNERVLEIIKYKNLTPSKFSDILGVPRSTISHIISGRNNPSLDLVTKISDKFPEINIDWLIKGSGSMLKKQTSLFESTTENLQQKVSFKESSQKLENENHVSSQIEPGKNKDKAIKPNSDSEKQTANDIELNKAIGTYNNEKEKISKIIIIFENGSFDVVYPHK